MLWRELRLKLLETRLQRVIGLIAILLLAAWFYWQAKPWKDEEWHVLPIFLGLSLHLLLACLYGSVAITVEKQESNWETLLCTPLTPSQILWPKFLGVFRRTAAPSAFVLLHLIVFSMASLIPFWLVIHYTMIAFSFAAFLCAVGLALSLHCGRSRSAMVSTLSVAIGLWGAPLIGLLIVAEFLGLYNETEAAARVLFSINPFAWMGAAAEPAAFSPRAMRLEYYEFVTDGTVSPARFTFMLTMASGAAFGLAMLIVSGLISGFNRVVGRTS